jgi:DNA-binding beta-propeller fold protein YncE
VLDLFFALPQKIASMKILLALSLSLATTTFALAQATLTKKWETPAQLKVPESVVVDAERSVLYVSNIDGTDPWAKDGKGSIGKVGLDGKIITVDWVSGLHGPKGLGLHQGKLYAADIDRVAVIDVAKGAIAEWIPIPGAQGLNDIAVDAKGVVFVTDTKARKVYTITNGKVATVIQDDRLKAPNGVLARGNEVFVVDFETGMAFKSTAGGALAKVGEGLEGGADGIEHVQGADYLVSCWGGVVYLLNVNTGAKTKLLDTRADQIGAADLGYDAKNKILYIPTFFKNSVAAYQLK